MMNALIVVLVLLLAISLFISGKIRSDIVALGALITLMLFGILTPTEALSGFSSSIVVMMIALFIVGGGIFQTGLANIISSRILKLAGNKPFVLYLLVMLTTVAIGAFVSNTGTVAVMLPIVVSQQEQNQCEPLVDATGICKQLGGMMTLIGTPPNLIINEELIKNGYESLSFFSFSSVGIILVVLGIIVIWPLSNLFLSKDNVEQKESNNGSKSTKELTKEYQISENLYRLRVRKGSPLVYKSSGVDIANNYNISILEIRRKEEGKRLFFKKRKS